MNGEQVTVFRRVDRHGNLLDGRLSGEAVSLDSADTDEKRLIGKLWEDHSEGKGLFMVVEKEVDGFDMREQLHRHQNR